MTVAILEHLVPLHRFSRQVVDFIGLIIVTIGLRLNSIYCLLISVFADFILTFWRWDQGDVWMLR